MLLQFLPRIDQILVFWSSRELSSIRKTLPAALSPADSSQKPSKADSKSNCFLYYGIFNMRLISKRLHLFPSSKIANGVNDSPSSQTVRAPRGYLQITPAKRDRAAGRQLLCPKDMLHEREEAPL